VREKLVDFLQREYPHALPQRRVQMDGFEQMTHADGRNAGRDAIGARPSD